MTTNALAREIAERIYMGAFDLRGDFDEDMAAEIISSALEARERDVEELCCIIDAPSEDSPFMLMQRLRQIRAAREKVKVTDGKH
jgi:hypothetical protein